MRKNWGKTRKITFSAVMVALYVTIMYATQSFAFGAYQIRLATGLYALSYLFPFLVLPMGIANLLSNFLGGLGVQDIVGGAIVGFATGGAVWAVRKWRLPAFLIIPCIIFIPGLMVPLWLSPLIGIPYLPLATSLCIGQTPPAILGYLLVRVLSKMEFLQG